MAGSKTCNVDGITGRTGFTAHTGVVCCGACHQQQQQPLCVGGMLYQTHYITGARPMHASNHGVHLLICSLISCSIMLLPASIAPDRRRLEGVGSHAPGPSRLPLPWNHPLIVDNPSTRLLGCHFLSLGHVSPVAPLSLIPPLNRPPITPPHQA